MKSFIYILIGYLFFAVCSAEKTGGENNFDKWVSEILDEDICTSLKISIDIYPDKQLLIHLHHWLLLFFVFWLSEDLGLHRVKNLCLGGIIQGIVSYTDWYKIVSVI